MVTIGIDPGKTGAIGVLDSSRKLTVHRFDKMTEQDVARVFWDLTVDGNIDMCYLEKVGAMPGQGVSSMFNFGVSAGFIRGILVACGVPFQFVTPQTWQKGLSLGKKYNSQTERKRAHRQMAEQLFPKRKITINEADGILITEYGFRQRA